MRELNRHESNEQGIKIWLIGGTSESAELALALSARQLPFVVTVTTEAARQLYAADTQVVVGKLTEAQMEEFAKRERVRCVLDASHPFARLVSEGAIALTHRSQHQQSPCHRKPAIAYIRYERKQVSDISTEDLERKTLERKNLATSPSEQNSEQNKHAHVSIHTSIESLLNNSQLHDQRILFTLGYHTLLAHSAQLAQLRQKSQLFARILPSQEAVSNTLASGFSKKEIIAIRPPISYELEKALWQQWNISLVIAKASGQAGGETIKRRVACDLGVKLRLLKRPSIAYPRQTNRMSEAIEFCDRQISEHRLLGVTN